MRWISFALLAAVTALGCKGDKSGAGEPQPEPSRPAATAACETLDRAECMGARHCTLHWVEDMVYECRVSEGQCETDLIQTDKPTCESRDGCAWDPGECYCQFPGYGRTQVVDKDENSGGACACGGGPPPRCKPGATP
jgi:hypothetical protein